MYRLILSIDFKESVSVDEIEANAKEVCESLSNDDDTSELVAHADYRIEECE